MSTGALHRPELPVRDSTEENEERGNNRGQVPCTSGPELTLLETDCPRRSAGKKELRSSLSMAPAI